jgi:hypothetical protein
MIQLGLTGDGLKFRFPNIDTASHEELSGKLGDGVRRAA